MNLHFIFLTLWECCGGASASLSCWNALDVLRNFGMTPCNALREGPKDEKVLAGACGSGVTACRKIFYNEL